MANRSFGHFLPAGRTRKMVINKRLYVNEKVFLKRFSERKLNSDDLRVLN